MSWLDPQIAHALGGTVLHSFWQAAFLAALIWWASRRPGLGPKSRYRLAYGTLLSQAVLGGFTFLFLLLSWEDPNAAALGQQSLETGTWTTGGTLVINTAADALPLTTATPALIPTTIAPAPLSWLYPYLCILWLLSMTIGCVRLVGGQVLIDTYYRKALRPLPEAWQKNANELLTRLKPGSRMPTLALSARINSPALIGHLRPIVLLPISMVNLLSPEQAEAVLAHELAHYARQDHWWNLLQSVLEIFFYFNPIVHWISNRIREEREHCCDELVTELSISPLLYAKTLFQLEEQRRSLSGVSLAARPGSLTQRIQRLLQGTQNHYRMKPGLLLFLLLSVGLLFSLSSPTTDNEIPEVTYDLEIQGDDVRMTFETEIDGETFTGVYLPEEEEFVSLQVENGEASLEHLPELQERLEAALIESSNPMPLNELPRSLVQPEVQDWATPEGQSWLNASDQTRGSATTNISFPDGLIVVSHSDRWRRRAMRKHSLGQDHSYSFFNNHNDRDRPQYMIFDGEILELWVDGQDIDMNGLTEEERQLYYDLVTADYDKHSSTPPPPPPPAAPGAPPAPPAPPAAPGSPPPPPPPPPPAPGDGHMYYESDDGGRVIIRGSASGFSSGGNLLDASDYENQLLMLSNSLEGTNLIFEEELTDVLARLAEEGLIATENLERLEERLAEMSKLQELNSDSLYWNIANGSATNFEWHDGFEGAIIDLDSMQAELEGLTFLPDTDGHLLGVYGGNTDATIFRLNGEAFEGLSHDLSTYKDIVETMQDAGQLPSRKFKRLQIGDDLIKVNGRRLDATQMDIFKNLWEERTGRSWGELDTHNSHFWFRD